MENQHLLCLVGLHGSDIRSIRTKWSRYAIYSLIIMGICLANPDAKAEEPRAVAFPVPPFVFEDGHGPMPEILSQAMHSIGWSKRLEILPARRVLSESEQSPLVVASLARTPERESKFKWVAEIVQASWRLARADNPVRVNRLEDLAGLGVVGVIPAGATEAMLRHAGLETIEYAETAELNAQKLSHHRIEFWYEVDVIIRSTWRRLDLPLSRLNLSQSFGGVHIWVAASPSTPDSDVAALAHAIAEMRRRGEIEAILRASECAC